MLISQLEKIALANKDAILENMENKVVDRSSYFERNLSVVSLSDELISFQVNDNEGTNDTIKKAEQKGILVKKFNYTID